MKMSSTKYLVFTSIREHIVTMVDMFEKLKTMDMEIFDGFLVHCIMTSLPITKFEVFKINYDVLKEKWNVSELIVVY